MRKACDVFCSVRLYQKCTRANTTRALSWKLGASRAWQAWLDCDLRRKPHSSDVPCAQALCPLASVRAVELCTMDGCSARMQSTPLCTIANAISSICQSTARAHRYRVQRSFVCIRFIPSRARIAEQSCYVDALTSLQAAVNIAIKNRGQRNL